MKRKKKIFGMAMVLLTGVLVVGLPFKDISGNCYEVKTRCHGIPVMGCIGLQSERTVFIEESDCDMVENISQSCGEMKRYYCQQGEVEGWEKKSMVEGKRCVDWMRNYNMSFESCE